MIKRWFYSTLGTRNRNHANRPVRLFLKEGCPRSGLFIYFFFIGHSCSFSSIHLVTRITVEDAQVFCECCGMHLRGSPHCGRVYKEKVRAKKKLVAVV